MVIDRGRVVADGSPAQLTGDAEVLTFTAAPGLDVAALAAELPEGSLVTESPAGSYRVEAPLGPEVLAAVSAWCAENGTSPRSLSSGRRSLEDVFLELTGRDLRP